MRSKLNAFSMSQFISNTKKEVLAMAVTTTTNTSKTTTAATSLEDYEQQPIFDYQLQQQQQQQQSLQKKVTLAKQPLSMPIPMTASAAASTTATAAASLNSPLSPRTHPLLSVFCWDQIDEKDDINAHVTMLRKSSQTMAKLQTSSEKLGSIESNDDYKIGHVGLSIDTTNSTLLHDSPKNGRSKNVEISQGTLDGSVRSVRSISMTSIPESPRLFMESPRLSPRAGEELLIFGDLEL